MSQGKTVKAFKQRVRENSAKFGGSKKPSAKVPILTKAGGTEDKLMKVKASSLYGETYSTSHNSTKSPKPEYKNNRKINGNNSTYKPRTSKKPVNATKKSNSKRPVKNLFFPDNIKTVPSDSHIVESKSKQVAQDLLNPYYAAMNTHIDNAINEVKKTCSSRTTFKVTSNRTKWSACHAITFDVRLISMTEPVKTRDLLIYFIKSNNKNITIVIANSKADSSAVVFHYSGNAASCPIAQYLPKILASTEELFSGVKKTVDVKKDNANTSKEVKKEVKKDDSTRV